MAGVSIALIRFWDILSSNNVQRPLSTTSSRQIPVAAVSHETQQGSTGLPATAVGESPSKDGITLATESVGPRIDLLLKSGRPTDAFEAYKLINKCVVWSDNARLLTSLPVGTDADVIRKSLEATIKLDVTACQGIDQRKIADRHILLDLASKYNVPGAALEFLSTGPYGDPSAIELRPNDPLVSKWRLQAIEYLLLAGRGGDVNAFAALSNIYQSGGVAERNLELSLTYAVASLEAMRVRGETSSGGERLVALLSIGLNTEQVTNATVNGLALAKQCCNR